jgi:subtilisin-like proprotein convertase family protein
MNCKTRLWAAGCVTALALAAPGAASATTGTFTSSTPVVIPDGGSAPASEIVVSGLPGLTNDVDVALTNLSHERVSDVDATLVAPNGGGSVVLLSDNGDATDILDAGLALSDEAVDALPVPLTAGSYKPFAALSGVDGFNPNGTWTLQLADDDATTDGGEASTGDIEGWAVTVSTNSSGQPPVGNPNAGPKPKKAHKPKKCKPKKGRAHSRKKPKKCKPKHRGLKKGHRR